MRRTHIPSPRAVVLGAILGAGVVVSMPTAHAAPESIYGKWNRDDGLGGVSIAPCGGAICGHVTWLKDKSGPGRIGERVFYDMHLVSAGNWSGHAFNPADGKEYAGTMVLSGNHLTTSGCVLGGLICKSLGLSRAR